MTLDTHIRSVDPVPAKPLFRFCQSLLSDHPEQQRWTDDDWFGTGSYRNACGQGLPAWLILTYGRDGPLPKEDDDDDPAACIDISFDTAYAWRGPNEQNCGDLHAWLVTMVTAWLDERGARWYWYDEWDGSWYDTLDKLEAKLGNPLIGSPLTPKEDIDGRNPTSGRPR